MTEREVFRYTDARGDTVIYKFDPALVAHPIESPITILHEWRQDFEHRIQLNSILLDKESIIKRYRKDKKPATGMMLWEGKGHDGKWIKCTFVPFDLNGKGFVVN